MEFQPPTDELDHFHVYRSEVTGHMKAESAPVHGSPPTGRHGPEGREASQGTPETSRGSTTSSLGDSSGESTQGTSTMSEESTEALQDHRTAPPTLSGHLGSVSTASLKTTAGLGTLAWTQSQPVPPEAADSAYDMLGVMPRRNQMPSPSSAAANPLNRVFKVIFLGKR